MIDRIAAFLRGRADAPETPPSRDDKQLAAAALMVEAALMDEGFDNRERRTIERLVVARFGLDEDECGRLIAAAEAAVAESNQLLRFTRAVKDQFAPEERVELIEMLWEVAYADGVLHDYEANLLRRVGGLIYVSDRDSGDARRRVLARLNASIGT